MNAMFEQVEACPYCDSENVYPGYDPEKDGYITKCKTCGCSIFLCDACHHAKDNLGGKCDCREEDGKSVCFRGQCDMPTYSNILARLPKTPQKDGGLWTDGDEILGGEEAINRMADILDARGYAACTGYYDPEEDKKNGETDSVTGYWYLEV